MRRSSRGRSGRRSKVGRSSRARLAPDKVLAGNVVNSRWVLRKAAEMRGGGREAHLVRSEEHTSELQSPCNLVCRLLLEKKKNIPARPVEILVAHSFTWRLSSGRLHPAASDHDASVGPNF